VVAANATVEAGPGVFGCDEQQVLRVVVDVVEQLGPVVAAAVGADVDGLLGEIASRSQLRLSVVGPERNLVLMGERPKVRVSLAVADISQGSFRRLVVADHRPVAYQIVQLVLKVVFLVVLLDRNARAAADLNVRRVLQVIFRVAFLVRSVRARAEAGLNVRQILVGGVV
jgi:hypothetical protein